MEYCKIKLFVYIIKLDNLITKKCVFLGNHNVGKTSVFNRLIHNYFDQKQESTFGACYSLKFYEYNNKNFKFNLWDTAGQERYKSLLPMYYRNANIIFLIYDLNDIDSLDRIIDFIEYLEDNKNKELIVLLGNKLDLIYTIDSDIEYKLDEIKKNLNTKYIELKISCKTNENFETLLDDICHEISENNNIYIKNNNVKLNDNQNDIKKKNTYCC